MNIIKNGLKKCMVSLADISGLRFNPEKLLPITYLKYDDKKEGRIFFVLTEDNEHPKGMIYGKSALTSFEMKKTLVCNLQLADEIANQYGIKWTHFVDIGSGLLLLKWVAEVSNNEEWITVYEKKKQALIQSYVRGNDIQLHIHNYHIPSFSNFKWKYDPIRNIIYTPTITSKKQRKRTFGGWATPYGGIENRVDSLNLGKKILEELFEQYLPEYKVVCFRAGGWDMGDNMVELQKSFSALAEQGILLDSSLTKGTISRARWLSDYGMTFEVGAPIDRNVYKVNIGINKMDGIFELLPTQSHWMSTQYITPLDNPKIVENIYNYLINKDGTVKPGFHFIVEMFHIHNIRDNSDDFKQMEYHFKYLKERCPKMEYLTGSEVVSILSEGINCDFSVRINQ